MSLYSELYAQRGSKVCFVGTVDSEDYIAFEGFPITIFSIVDDELFLFSEFNHDDQDRAAQLVEEHIKEANEESYA